VVILPAGRARAFSAALDAWAEGIAEEYRDTDPGLRLVAEKTGIPGVAFDPRSTAVLLRALNLLPHGVIAMSEDMEGLVETSTNVSSVRTLQDEVVVHASHRSSWQETLDQIASLHRCIADLVGGAVSQDQGYPAWTPDPSSPLLAAAGRAVRRVTGREAAVRAIHAGLECGVIKARLPGMDAVSVGPTIRSPNSPHERVHIPSVGEFYRILTEILASAGQGAGA
jgi:dipeptidase D